MRTLLNLGTCTPRRAGALVALAAMLTSSSVLGQSLFLQPREPQGPQGAPPGAQQPAPAGGPFASAPPPDHGAALRGVSLTYVERPAERTFQVHDTLSVIIQEQSRQSSTAQLDTEKQADIDAGIDRLPDLIELLQLRLDSSDRADLIGVGAQADRSFEGDGSYQRTEQLQDRIQATIIDIKPNGTMVLEARRTIVKDKQTQVVVLGGIVRREDVTSANTVLSSQLAELTVRIESEGDVAEAAEKGFFTRIFDAIFNF